MLDMRHEMGSLVPVSGVAMPESRVCDDPALERIWQTDWNYAKTQSCLKPETLLFLDIIPISLPLDAFPPIQGHLGPTWIT